jgi:phosphoribosylglycinamide formyltransferase-1
VPVLPGDTPETLAARVLAAEHRLYPRALALVALGQAVVADAVVGFQGIEDIHFNQGDLLLSPPL